MYPCRFLEKSGSTYSWTIVFRFTSALDVTDDKSTDATRPDRGREPASFEICCKLRRDVAALLFDVIHDVRLFHHVPLPKRDQPFEVVRQQFSTDIYPGINLVTCAYVPIRKTTYLFTADQTTLPPIIGTMCVKLKPASTTSMHSGFGSPRDENS